jgi:hypothetical protein
VRVIKTIPDAEFRVSPVSRAVNRVISQLWINRYNWSDTAFLLVDPIDPLFLVRKCDWHLLPFRSDKSRRCTIKLCAPLLTLFTTPVVYIYLDRLQALLHRLREGVKAAAAVTQRERYGDMRNSSIGEMQ